MRLATLLANGERAAQRTSATMLDGPHGFELIRGHFGTVLLSVRFTVTLKDFSH
jgi:hypothetical protein